MYLVYRVSMNREEVKRGDNILGVYARRGGAILRLEMLAHANRGTLYGIGILPEGAKPVFDNVKSVYATLRVDESEGGHVTA